MKKNLFLFLLFFFGNLWILRAQEFSCNVSINAASVRGSNKQVFKTLEQAIKDFVNTNRWTDKQFQAYERIKCDILLNIKNYNINTNRITAELYFRSYRPVYNSDYQTLMLNLIDSDFNFNYREFEKLDFNVDFFENNLTSTIAFYLYIALGYDANSFKENDGKKYFEIAERIQLNAEQNTSDASWKRENKNNSKGDFIEQLLNENTQFYHKAIYTYHRWGLDVMSDKLAMGKNNIITAINYLQKFKENNRDGDYLLKVFFDAKSDEITQIFSAGPTVNKSFVVKKLRNLAPNYDFKWDEIMKATVRHPNQNRLGSNPPQPGFNNEKMKSNRFADKEER